MHRLEALAISFAFALGSLAQAQGLPWKPGDKAPTLAGFELHESVAAARAELGSDATVTAMGEGLDAVVTYSNDKLGVSFLTRGLDGVTGIYVMKREAGVLDSVRVGDPREGVFARWGRPTRTVGGSLLWLVGDWSVSVNLGEDNRVIRLGIDRQR